MLRHLIRGYQMAKKKTARKKPVKKSKTVKSRRAKSVKPRGAKAQAARKTAKRKAPKPKAPKSRSPGPQYGPSFFLTADSDTAPAYEIDGTPHAQTIQSYRLAQADIREFEEQDGKILYKVKPLMAPAG
jgi:hypothetical protein